jgi:LmbE family N-acetylglucosaminyl deacetylase
MKHQFKRVLVLAPHTDDGEFGCGGTIRRLVDSGAEVHYAAFSACEQSVLPQFPKDILVTEVKAATLQLGIKPENLHLFKFEVRTFNFHRQEILDEIIKLRSKINPDLVLMPSIEDIHQDHATIANEAVRAFKFTTILCYELPWNNFNFTTTCFFHLEEKYIQAKLSALQQYKSQAHRPYANEEFIRGLASTRGIQTGTKYAEVFEVKRWIIN